MMEFKFEVRKFFSQTKNSVIISLILIFSLGLCFNHNIRLKKEKEMIRNEASKIYLKLVEDIGNDYYEERYPELQEEFRGAMASLDNSVIYSNSREWKKSLKEENKFIEHIMTIQKKIALPYIPLSIKQTRAENNYFLEHNIKPDNAKFGVSAMYYVRLVLSGYFSIYGLMSIMLLFYDLFIKEKERKNINWLHTLPINYGKFNMVKVILIIIFSLIFPVLLGVISFTFGILSSKIVGTLFYPVLFNLLDETLDYLQFSNYLIVSVCLFLLVVYILILFLLLMSRKSVESEKVLLGGVVSLVVISQFTKFYSIYTPYLLVINYINIPETIEEIFKQDLFKINTYIIIGLSFVLIIMTPVLLYEKSKKCIEKERGLCQEN